MLEMIAELRKLTIDELIKKHDALARHAQVSTNHYLEELYRRDQECVAEKMLTYTRWITTMTVVVTLATVANLAILWLER